MVRSILWFRQDLRLHDNEALLEAIRSSDELIPVYVFNPDEFQASTSFGIPKTGEARTRFIIESIDDLRSQLQAFGSDLVIRKGDPSRILAELALSWDVSYVYCNRERTRDEVLIQDQLEKNLWATGREVRYSRGKMLYYTSDLPFPVTHCPDSFAVFKKETEHIIQVRQPLPKPEKLPHLPGGIDRGSIPSVEDLLEYPFDHQDKFFDGGETVALSVLRNGWSLPPFFLAHEGTVFSPWVALGCLSPKEVYYHYQDPHQSIEEVRQNLLYRDYLRLMGKKYGDQIFHKSGIRGIPFKAKDDPVKYERWTHGMTGIEIIDAGMHQLNQTGWLPDILRRLIAGYFIKVLQLDWRLGAAWFESRLIDYDPTTNWVSWMNMAGLGPDMREDRVLNYETVGRRIDPQRYYIQRWNSQLPV